MSKYTEAISSIYFTMHNRVKPKTLGHCEDKNLELLEELVERDTPKKPIQKAAGRTVCPNCERSIAREVSPRYCSICGQRLDWSEE